MHQLAFATQSFSNHELSAAEVPNSSLVARVVFAGI